MQASPAIDANAIDGMRTIDNLGWDRTGRKTYYYQKGTALRCINAKQIENHTVGTGVQYFKRHRACDRSVDVESYKNYYIFCILHLL